MKNVYDMMPAKDFPYPIRIPLEQNESRITILRSWPSDPITDAEIAVYEGACKILRSEETFNKVVDALNHRAVNGWWK